jgi:hypothetical protein
LDGNFTDLANRTDEGWMDLVQEINVKSGANAPSFENFRDGLYAYQFAAATMNECFVNFHIPHEYNVNGPTGNSYPGMIYPHVHWATNTTSTGTVRWGVEYTFARREDGNTGQIAFPATQTLYIEHDIVANEQYVHQVNESAEGLGIPSGGQMQVDALVLCRVFRDAAHVNDTFPDPVFLLTADVHIPVNVFSTPSRFPPFT